MATATGEQVVSRGVEALARLQSPGGWWTEWRAVLGGSDEFITALSAARLADVPGTSRIVAHARRALLDRRKFRAALGLECWGWNVSTAGDADTTAWAMRALRDQAPLEATAFLRRHVRPGGVGSYEDEAAIRSFWGAAYPPDHDLSAWTGPTATITAAVAAAVPELAPAMRAALRDDQHPDGTWRDIWWAEHAHTMALVVTQLRDPADRPAVARAAAWCRDTLDDENPFGLASRVLVWCRAAEDDPAWHGEIRAAVLGLRSLQQPDGLWPSSAPLTVSDASDDQPWRHHGGQAPGAVWPVTEVADDAAVMTTTSVLAALTAAARTRVPGPSSQGAALLDEPPLR